MPRMDGLTFLKKIMSQHPIPVVICSSLVDRGAQSALKALEYGAVEVIAKPRMGTKQFLEDSRVLVCDAVKAAAGARVRPLQPERKMRRSQPVALGEVEQDAAEQHLLTVTQLDQAASAAVMLAQVIASSGDKFALMTYGRKVQQQLLPGAGPSHLRLLIDQLSQVRSEASEADHLHAVARLKNLQRNRGLILWITEMAESAGRPEVVAAAAELVRRHLVVLILLTHPELDALAVREPRTVDEMFASTAAQEMLERRRTTLAQLRQQGVLVVETTPTEVGADAITKYLEVKAQGLL